MEQFIGCDAHKKFSVFVAVNERGHAGEAVRVDHDRQLYREFLARLPSGSVIALEACGVYSWLVDEMEWAGHSPRLANPLEAKRRMGLTSKTDKLDAKGLAILGNNIVDIPREKAHTLNMERQSPDTLRDAIIYFADFENCRRFMMELRWPSGKVT